ncbi:MAG: 5'/3'-nucleotidase SurE [Lentisphaeria bacterium]|nr:5'/3'-nucleotidase SurE [Candidatus Neomarinimicrobiota bacterium]MCF7841327.1 5'/3'-nucleotidase SurE [Lentisphaeria bacterium]
MSRPKLLLTNDDGINAPGIAALAQAVKPLGDIFIVAPISEMSAMGHAITLSDPIKMVEISKNGDFFGYGIGGTPSDCVKLAIHGEIIPRPDLVISGINQGANLGIDIIYSGTVAGAYEGSVLGVPSMAISLNSFTRKDFSPAGYFARYFAGKILTHGLPKGTLLNINIPDADLDDIRGISVVRQGQAEYHERFDRRLDPRQRVYYWLSGQRDYKDLSPDLDEIAIQDNHVTVTPIHYDLTNYELLDSVKSWGLNMQEIHE